MEQWFASIEEDGNLMLVFWLLVSFVFFWALGLPAAKIAKVPYLAGSIVFSIGAQLGVSLAFLVGILSESLSFANGTTFCVWGLITLACGILLGYTFLLLSQRWPLLNKEQ